MINKLVSLKDAPALSLTDSPVVQDYFPYGYGSSKQVCLSKKGMNRKSNNLDKRKFAIQANTFVL